MTEPSPKLRLVTRTVTLLLALAAVQACCAALFHAIVSVLGADLFAWLLALAFMGEGVLAAAWLVVILEYRGMWFTPSEQRLAKTAALVGSLPFLAWLLMLIWGIILRAGQRM